MCYDTNKCVYVWVHTHCGTRGEFRRLLDGVCSLLCLHVGSVSGTQVAMLAAQVPLPGETCHHIVKLPFKRYFWLTPITYELS